MCTILWGYSLWKVKTVEPDWGGPDWAGHIFPSFYNQLIIDGNLTTYWLKYWFSDKGFLVFSNQNEICIPMMYNVTIFDKIDLSPLRNISRQKLCSLKWPIKTNAQTFGRDAQCQKSSNLIYFHNQMSKQLCRNLGH